MDLQGEPNYSKSVANTTFAKFCSRAKTDIALDLLSVAVTVNATFAQDLHLCAKIMCSHEFKDHLQMVQMWTQMCFFELSLLTMQI